MSINAITTSLLGIQAKTNVKTDVQSKKQDSTSTQLTQQKTQMSADDVFKYMSATTTTPVQLKKAVNVSAYVDDTSASRISSSMKDFEKEFSTKLTSVKAEFGGISNELAEKITLSMF